MTQKFSEYMHWAKTQSKARYNLATSGVGAFPLSDLPYDRTRLEIHGNNSYGYAPLQQAIGSRAGVDPACVVTAAGTSFANFLAMASLLEQGDEVLVEHPAYGLLVDTANYITGNVKRFARREENGYALEAAEVRKALSPKTRLIVISNLHNPSSVLAGERELSEVADLAAGVGARLLVDEVYLDAVYESTPPTAFHLAPNIVITSSLTKVYGVSGLRCGWILAQPDEARAMWRLNDLFAATPAHPAELLSVAVFEHLELLRDRARRVVEADRALLGEFLDRESAITAQRTKFGTTAFLRLRDGDADTFLARLRAEYDTSAVPGRFFGMNGHLRVGMGVNTEMFGEGLRRMSAALQPHLSRA
jgi:hypothetical protein